MFFLLDITYYFEFCDRICKKNKFDYTCFDDYLIYASLIDSRHGIDLESLFSIFAIHTDSRRYKIIQYCILLSIMMSRESSISHQISPTRICMILMTTMKHRLLTNKWSQNTSCLWVRESMNKRYESIYQFEDDYTAFFLILWYTDTHQSNWQSWIYSPWLP